MVRRAVLTRSRRELLFLWQAGIVLLFFLVIRIPDLHTRAEGIRITAREEKKNKVSALYC